MKISVAAKKGNKRFFILDRVLFLTNYYN
jgi:hypothetical protein